MLFEYTQLLTVPYTSINNHKRFYFYLQKGEYGKVQINFISTGGSRSRGFINPLPSHYAGREESINSQCDYLKHVSKQFK